MYLTLATLLATIATGVLPRVASAQRVAGSLGVALTVLPPVASQAVTITGFRIDRDGMASFRASVPMTSGSSQLVMTRVSSSADRFVAVRLLPDVVRRSIATEIATREVAYRIEVIRSADRDAPHEVQLRVECLVVAGT